MVVNPLFLTTSPSEATERRIDFLRGYTCGVITAVTLIAALAFALRYLA